MKSYPAALSYRVVILLIAGLWCYATGVLFFHLHFALDEFTYAHAGWLISQGLVPYKDFPLFHFPFTSQFLSAVIPFLSPRISVMVDLRVVTLFFFGIAAGAVWILNASSGRFAQALSVVLLLVVMPFSASMVEIRPDSFAFALCLAAIAIFFRSSSGGSAVLSGITFGLACWSSEKAIIYAFPWGIYLALELRSSLRARLSIAGLAFITGVILFSLFTSDSWNDFWHFTWDWARLHELHYPRRSPHFQFFNVLLLYSWVFALVPYGLRRSSDIPRWLFVSLLTFSLLTYFMQRGPYLYSLIPFLGFAILCAGRGAQTLFDMAIRNSFQKTVPVWANAVLIPILALGFYFVKVPAELSNVSQRKLFNDLERLVHPSDPIYDNGAIAVTRPHVSYFYFTDMLIRNLLADELETQIPQALTTREVPAVVRDERFYQLPRSVRSFVYGHYVPYSEELMLLGQCFSLEPGMSREFSVIKRGQYFVSPDTANVRLDVPFDSSRNVLLEKGRHEVINAGTMSLSACVLWLPASAERYQPQRN